MLTQLTDLAARAVGRLAQQYRGKPKVEGVISAVSAQAQALENALFDLFVNRRLDTAVGAQLDVCGKIVKQPRGTSVDDDEYRARIKAKIRINLSSGTIEDVLAVFRCVFATRVVIVADFPAGFVATLVGVAVSESTATLLASFLAAARSGGVRALLRFSTATPSNTFACAVCQLSDILFEGDTVIPLGDISDWPSSGTVVINPGASDEETIAYSSRNDSTLFLDGDGLVNTHVVPDDLNMVVLVDTVNRNGFGNLTSGSGGVLSGVLEA